MTVSGGPTSFCEYGRGGPIKVWECGPGFYRVETDPYRSIYWLSPKTGVVWCIYREMYSEKLKPIYGITWKRKGLPEGAMPLSDDECENIVIPKEIADLDDQIAMDRSIEIPEALKVGFDMAIARYMIKRSGIESALDRVFAVVDAKRSPRISVDVEGAQFVFVTIAESIRAQCAGLASEGDFFYFCRRPQFYRKHGPGIDVGNVRDDSPIDDYPWCLVLRPIDWNAVDRWFNEEIEVIVRKHE